jgi:hypothetical protein
MPELIGREINKFSNDILGSCIFISIKLFFVPKPQLFFLCLPLPATYCFWFFRTKRWLNCKLAINGGDEMLALLGRETKKFSNDILGSYIFISIKLFFVPKLQLFFLCLPSPAAYIFWIFKT